MRIWEYDEMTPHELNLHIHAYNEQAKAEDREGITLAYLTAYYSRVKKMPDLKSLLNREKPKRRLTPEQMLEKAKRLNAALGGTREVREWQS